MKIIEIFEKSITNGSKYRKMNVNDELITLVELLNTHSTLKVIDVVDENNLPYDLNRLLDHWEELIIHEYEPTDYALYGEFENGGNSYD